MSLIRLIPLGVGDAFSALHYTTSLALGVDDDWLLIDCPHPIRKMLREASLAAKVPLDLDRITGVLLSHLHADHCSGVEDYGYYSFFALGRRAPILMHADVSARLWDGVLSAGMGQFRIRPDEPPKLYTLDDYFELTTLSESAAISFGPFAIECRSTIHPIPTTAFRVKLGGRTVGFSADTAFDPTLIDWLADADLIVHEATHYAHSEVHTPYVKLAGLPQTIRDKMRLIHYPDDFEASTSTIELLRQGRCYVV
jgi:ribonuclease BN (tRNA processing enzyme)